ncbi:MAG TPA: ABC transporter permease [Blastocatellia bacterium]|nr:ABC transporter permease [Blastocatellia bacterium]
MKRRRRILEGLDEEIREHIERETQDNIDRGMSPEEARSRALRKFGNVTLVIEDTRAVWRYAWLEQLTQDIFYALRMMRKFPGFTAVVVLTLALGIGANTAIFSVVEGAVLAPLPYPGADRLVNVWETNPRFSYVMISYPNFRDWQRSSHSFESMAALFPWEGYDLTSPGTPEHLNGKAISAGYFATLSLKLTRGRDFNSQEDAYSGAPAVIISERLWRNRFDSSPDALGKSVTLNGVDRTIIGIASTAAELGVDADVYTPLAQGDPLVVNNRANHSILSIARLKPGVSISQAQAEMNAIQKSLDDLYPTDDRDLGTDVWPLKRLMIGDASGTMLLLLGAVALVLLIACANVANLLLARSATRSREFAVRSALGASRVRVVRQLLTEGVLLSLAGGVLGVVAAAFGIKPLLALAPEAVPRAREVGLNFPVLLFALGISLSAGILFGLAPALKNSNADLQYALKEGGRTASGGGNRVQSALVIAQVALTLVLLAGAGLLLRTMRDLTEVNPGFDAERVMTFKVGVSHPLTKTADGFRNAYQGLIERIRKVPGVQAADYTALVPLSGMDNDMPFWIGSDKPASLQAAPRLLMYLTGPDYLKTMGIPLLRGRFFTPEDTTKSPLVMVIDEEFARTYFADKDPIGQTISAGFAGPGPCTIVGVVGHVRHWGLEETGPYTRTQAYFPLLQDPDKWVPVNYSGLTVVVRTGFEPIAMMPAIRDAIYSAGKDQPVYEVKSMQQLVSASMAQRFPMILLGAFAALALVLASIGIYGVTSYSVTRRMREIGICMALGADRWTVFSTVIGQGLRLVLTGLGLGLLGALALTRLLSSFSSLLYGVSASDPVTFAAVSIACAGVVILACYVPARRATRIDPMISLRSE